MSHVESNLSSVNLAKHRTLRLRHNQEIALKSFLDSIDTDTANKLIQLDREQLEREFSMGRNHRSKGLTFAVIARLAIDDFLNKYS